MLARAQLARVGWLAGGRGDGRDAAAGEPPDDGGGGVGATMSVFVRVVAAEVRTRPPPLTRSRVAVTRRG